MSARGWFFLSAFITCWTALSVTVAHWLLSLGMSGTGTLVWFSVDFLLSLIVGHLIGRWLVARGYWT